MPEAAKWDKKLSRRSKHKTNDGKLISSDMIDGYKELNKNISETINIIEDVSEHQKSRCLELSR